MALLERGDAVVIFPEGTRIRAGSLAQPKRGVGRLALAERRARGADRDHRHRARPRRLEDQAGARARAHAAPALTIPRVENPSPFLAGEVTERIWPCVGLQWEWLGGLPPLRTAAVVGGGSMGTAIASVLARAGLEVQLGCRTTAQAARLLARPRERRLPARRGARRGDRAQDRARDRVRGRRPGRARRALQQPARRGRRDRRARGRAQRRAGRLEGPRAAARHHAHAPTWPSACRARAVASLGGPAHAREAIEVGAAVVVATRDPRPAPPAARGARRRRPDRRDDRRRDRRRAGRLRQERRGARLRRRRACAAPTSPARRPGRVFSEVHELAAGERRAQRDLRRAGRRRRPGRHRDRRGQPQPARRRAGRRPGMPAVQVEADGGSRRPSRSRPCPLLSEAFAREGIDAPITTGLRRVLDGEASPEQWLESVRSADPEAEDARGLTARAAPSRLRYGWTRSPTSSDSIATSPSSTGPTCATSTRTPTTGSATTTTPRT